MLSSSSCQTASMDFPDSLSIHNHPLSLPAGLLGMCLYRALVGKF